MLLKFAKYQGSGNDFILVDNRKNPVNPDDDKLIRFLCNRRFGIGADGLILLHGHPSFDFEMKYFNSDGYEGTMCGNGGRCITAFSKSLGITENHTEFLAIDGPHTAKMLKNGDVVLKMNDVRNIVKFDNSYFMDTGSPHFVVFVEDVSSYDVEGEGRKLRSDARFCPDGTNVDFVTAGDDSIVVRTYERGVESETLSCGTGAVAVAVSCALHCKPERKKYLIKVTGGSLTVQLQREHERFYDIWLGGQVKHIFDGRIKI
ncbi:MAG: diaminopimelate epimerase [Bacteroidetes bacterium]|nr:diaminopimelate epimerase [Bacteroidota bacterium]